MHQLIKRFLIVAMVLLVGCTTVQPSRVERQADGIVIPLGQQFLKLQVCSDNIIRVMYASDRRFFDRATVATEPKRVEPAVWTLASSGDETTLVTKNIRARVNLQTGAVAFLDSNGQPILVENSRVLASTEVQGEKTSHARQTWQPNSGESLYGLGQHQLGLMDIKGHDIDLWQHNGTVAIPMLVSSRGYGIFWDNTSYTRFGDLRPWELVRAVDGFKGSYFAGANFEKLVATRTDEAIDIARPPPGRSPNTRIHPDLPQGDISVRWEGEIAPKETGDNQFQTISNCGIKLFIDDKLVIEHWRQGWLPWKDIAKLRLEANRPYRVRLEWSKDQGDETVQLFWKTPAPDGSTSLWSEVADGIDYYFIHGPQLDKVVAGYRQLTGEAPMMPVWAMGLWQCRQRYKTSQEVLDILEGYRSRNIPIDNIVQDWFYWKEDQWGSHQFESSRFPDPAGWIRTIHERYHARLMISVWPKFYPGTANFEELNSRGFLYQPNLKENLRDWVGRGYNSTFYDAFNPEARKMFWEQVRKELLTKNVDAWWLDATEPDLTPRPTLEGQRTHVHPTAMGTGSRVLNAYSLLNSQAVYEGQRAALPNQRVFILTRSAFAGQQRYASAVWSGDISSTWAAFRKQIPAGLSFCLSGIPYWTTDIGGFSVPPKWTRRDPKPEDVEEWRELNNRWFQFGTFCPLLRVHGEFPNREMWEFGGDSSPTFQSQLKFDRLRYRMFPYVYSLAGAVTHDGGTMMRPLVMDFPDDSTAHTIGDQFMFGPSMLISPVTTYKARDRSVYLPKGSKWYDLWSGAMFDGGQTIASPAPYDSIPIHVRAGSIIPLGPGRQYTTEKAVDPITLLIYTGADGEFRLYEDDGLTYGYEKGQSARIPIRWSEANQTLTIGQREGSFAKMLEDRTFNVVLISKARPVAFSFTPTPDRSARYRGEPVQIKAGDRIEPLLSQMTLEEKISLVHGNSKFTTPPIPRLGIPTRWLADGPHGVREDVGPDTWDPAGRTDDFATWMPVSMTLASTFNPDLAVEYGKVIGEEARARGKHIMLGPAVNIQRTPLCGRNFEYMGEDPFLTSRIAVGYIKGLQAERVAACVKHFAANNQETQRGSINVEVDERTLREIYLPAFRAAVQEAGVLTVMGAYNKLRTQHCCHNEWLLNKILKGEWNFQGLVMSDWSGTHDTREAALYGLDLEMGTNKPYDEFYFANPLRDGIVSGQIPMSVLDDKIRRNLRVMEASGMFDAPLPGKINTPEHQGVARRVAEEGIVLLKNDRDLLPLDASKITSIAVIGENAVRRTAYGGGAAGIKAFYEITPLEGITNRVGPGANVTFSTGYRSPARGRRGSTRPATTQSSEDLIERAVAAAKASDVAVIVGGLNHNRNFDDEGTDRRDMKMPWNQDELIARVVEANPRTIVVLFSGAAVEMDQWLDKVPALLQAWYPGMEGGNALARILFGDVNPSGKLPCTFPKKLADSPAHALNAFPGKDGVVKYEEGLLVGYRWFDAKNIEPQFPFGHGLSYTKFEYSNLRIGRTPPPQPSPGVPGVGEMGDTVVVEFDITNSGRRGGAEIAQVYVQGVESSLPRPPRELKAIRRVVLASGEKQTVSIELDRKAFAYYDPEKAAWVAEAGEFTIHVGSSSRDLRLTGTLRLDRTVMMN